MARQRSPNRDEALKIYLKHKGNITNRAITEILGEKEKTISNRKSRDAGVMQAQTALRGFSDPNQSYRVFIREWGTGVDVRREWVCNPRGGDEQNGFSIMDNEY